MALALGDSGRVWVGVWEKLEGKGLGCDAFFCLECDAESFSQL